MTKRLAAAPTRHSADDAHLSATTLSGSALSCLRRAGITSQGELVRVSAQRISALHGLGAKKREEVLALRRSLIESGVGAEENNHRSSLLRPTPIGDLDAYAVKKPVPE